MSARLALAAALLIGSAAPALATDLSIENFVGTITVVEGPATVDVIRSDARLEYVEGETIRIDGGIRKPGREELCNGGRNGFTLSINGRDRIGGDKRFESRLDNYPELKISLPEGSTLSVDNSMVRLSVEPTLSQADVDIMGCLDTQFGDVLEATVDMSGSGDLTARSLGEATFAKSGSGDIEADDIGTLSLSQSGSGDMLVGRVGRSATIRKSGSGDIDIGLLLGALDLSQSGSGDLSVEGGDIPRATISMSGSGDVDLDATVGDAKIRTSGSSEVSIRSLSGDLDQKTSGSSEVSIGEIIRN